MGHKDVNMLSGSITKGLLAISLPVMIMNVVQSLFAVVDMAILKAYDPGGMAVGAVGVCGMLITLITGIVIGISTGANVVIARCIGRKDQPGTQRAVGCSFAFSIAAGIGLALFGIAGAELFLRWNNCPEALLSQATLYFRIYFSGMPFLMVYNFCAAILRSSGDTRRPMVFLTIGGAVKMALTLLFVAVFDMSVGGVAVATVISWALSMFLCLQVLVKSQSTTQLQAGHIRFYKTELSQILHIGVPAGLQQGLYAIANVIISATVNTFGPEATTGISIANNYDGILYQISTATAIAIVPYVSQNIACGNVSRALESVKKSILITVALGATFGALSAIFSAELSSVMSSDPVVIAYSRQKMVIVSSTYFICGINEILGSALRGMGKPVSATVSTLLFLCALRFVWVYLIFPLLPNLSFLYLVWPIGWVLSIIMLLCILLPTAKKLATTPITQ